MFKYINYKLFSQLVTILFIQQLMIAYGTYSLIMAGKEVGQNNQIILWLIIFILSFLFSPLLTILAKKIETKVSFNAFSKYLHFNLYSKSAQSRAWQSTKNKELFLTSTGLEAESYLTANIFVVSDLITYCFSILFNGLVIGFVLDIQYLFAYSISILFSGMFFYSFKGRFESYNESEQLQRSQLNNILLKSWDNLLINNVFLICRYRKVIHHRLINTQLASENAVVKNELMVNLLFIFAALPVSLVSIEVIHENIYNTSMLIAVIASIPRQLQILSVFRSIFQTLNSYVAFNAKLKVLIQGSHFELNNIENQIQIEKININNLQFNHFNEVLQLCDKQNGRFTIRGENGSGKSSLLLLINEKRPDSILLPANAQFIDEYGEEIIGSTGQRIVQFIEMVKNEKYKILLLDEWDAHTDENNSEKYNIMIDEIAKDKIVIEVKHGS